METHHTFRHGLTFDDVLIQPAYAGFFRNEVSLVTQLTRTIQLQLPLVASPMDTVTESALAIALARAGGIGIIHRNLPIVLQAEEVSRVKKHKLLVGAAIGSSPGYEARVEALITAKVDVILVDSAHGFSKSVIETTSLLKRQYPKQQVISGSVATFDGAKALIDAGADAIRVGMGPGAICTTRIVSGMGVPQITALQDVVKAAREAGVPVIADGGITYSGDMVKALGMGASTVMMGSFFAATVEAPGKTVELTAHEVPKRFKSIIDARSSHYLFKEYRGMGSVGAMETGKKIGSEDEFHGKRYQENTVMVAEGVEGLVPVRGTVQERVDQVVGGIRSGFYYCGAKTIPELWETATFLQITAASLRESHPHDILVTNSGQSYE